MKTNCRNQEKPIRTSVRIQLSGPMSGIEDFNRKAFKEAAADLRTRGYYVHDPSVYSEDQNYGDLLLKSLKFICTAATLVITLPGWEASPGACAEVATARACGVSIQQYEACVR